MIHVGDLVWFEIIFGSGYVKTNIKLQKIDEHFFAAIPFTNDDRGSLKKNSRRGIAKNKYPLIGSQFNVGSTSMTGII